MNLIQDTFAALALATDGPSAGVLDRSPRRRGASIFTPTMWKMVTGQTLYQMVVVLVLHFKGARILGYDVVGDPERQTELGTVVFNAYVWMQICNVLNCRRLDNRVDVFEGILKNWFCVGMLLLMVVVQVLIVCVGSLAFSISRIDGAQWAICIVAGLLCLPWGVVLKCVQVDYFVVVFLPVVRAFRAVLGPCGRVFLRLLEWTRGCFRFRGVDGNRGRRV